MNYLHHLQFQSLTCTQILAIVHINLIENYEEKKPKEDSIKEGIFYFNNERFWECHEILESVWKNCYEGERDLVQGIILVAAALVHYQKNENKICISILGRALKKLSNATGNYYNIDVDSLKNKIAEMKNSGQVATFVIYFVQV